MEPYADPIVATLQFDMDDLTLPAAMPARGHVADIIVDVLLEDAVRYYVAERLRPLS